jgi:hypothetical protein
MARMIPNEGAPRSFMSSGGVMAFIALSSIAALASACGSKNSPDLATNGDTGSPPQGSPDSAVARTNDGATNDDGGTSVGNGPNDAGSSTDDSTAPMDTTEGGEPDSASGDAAGSTTNDAGSGTPTGDGGVVSLFDGTTLSGWIPSRGTGIDNVPAGDVDWDVQDGALHSTGGPRGTLISKDDYGSFRLMFWVRQLVTNIHYASVLIWGTRPPPDVDAIGGLQFSGPNGDNWDYRPGAKNPDGFFTQKSPGLSRANWAQCELLTDVTAGTALMACCTPVGTTPCKAVQVLSFHDPKAGKSSPIALQVHSAGTQDEYKNITIEVNPAVNALSTTQ